MTIVYTPVNYKVLFSGATGLVQPLDVVINAPFKSKIENQACTHLQENLEAYMQGNVCSL